MAFFMDRPHVNREFAIMKIEVGNELCGFVTKEPSAFLYLNILCTRTDSAFSKTLLFPTASNT